MSTHTANHFSRTVRDRLLENKLAGRKPDSIRSLARSLSNGDVARFETMKRSLFKWMAEDGPNPSRESRVLVARELGLEDSALDDEESSLSFGAAMQSLFDQAVARAVANLVPQVRT